MAKMQIEFFFENTWKSSKVNLLCSRFYAFIYM
jgi:hypothetical protein